MSRVCHQAAVSTCSKTSDCPQRKPPRGGLCPFQSLNDGAAHHPVLVALAEKAQLLGELADALAVARLGIGIRQIGAPVTPLRAVGIEHALDMPGNIAERIGFAR